MSWKIVPGTGPVIVTAIHAGHQLRPDLWEYMALDEHARLREEDPYTEHWTEGLSSRIVVDTSRFEVDLNRQLERAVYMGPQDAWGLTVWKTPLPAEVLQASQQKWLSFYDELAGFLDGIHAEFGRFVVLDIHSYCHRRGGPKAAPDDPLRNPEINLGTASIDRSRWSPLLDRFIGELGAFDEGGGEQLDVRENVKFTGGHFSRWINHRYGSNACAVAIEFKKTFMDEWTGELDPPKLETLKRALASTLPGLHEELAK